MSNETQQNTVSNNAKSAKPANAMACPENVDKVVTVKHSTRSSAAKNADKSTKNTTSIGNFNFVGLAG